MKETQQFITHQNIADRIGCHKSTISLALRGDSRLSVKTRENVRRLAVEMGYRLDPALAQLAKYRWQHSESRKNATLHYLHYGKNKFHAVQMRHFDFAQECAHVRGYEVLKFDLAECEGGIQASRLLLKCGARGLIIPAMPLEAQGILENMKWDNFTVIGCHRGWLRIPFHSIYPNTFEGIRYAWCEALRRGYRRIGCALFQHDPMAINDFIRIGACYAKQSEETMPEDRIPFLQSQLWDRSAFKDWVQVHRPDVIISLMARPVVQWLNELGYRILEDITLISLLANRSEPFTGIDNQHEEVARSAVDFLINEMSENAWGCPSNRKDILLKPKWHEGATLPWRKGYIQPDESN